MVADAHDRPLESLRISVTDRCNLRCSYCMPEKDYVWLPREQLLTFGELVTVVGAFADLGVTRLRLTGGEPLVRTDLPVLVGMLAAEPGLRDFALTTNGVLLAAHARELAAAGLQRITISVDTLRRDRFAELSGRDDLHRVIEGIEAAAGAGFASLKTNMVVIRGANDDEIVSMLEFGRWVGAEVRFIEYMDVGGATRWADSQVFTRGEILEVVQAAFGSARPERTGNSSAPADRYRLADGTTFGIISSTTEPFCGSCDRIRLTADGKLFTCLYARNGFDLAAVLRGGASRADLRDWIAGIWERRHDRGAEQRLQLQERAPLARASELRDDPHLEMHTRGG